MNQEYKCGICGEIHNDYPALAYPSPDSYYWLSDDEKIKYNAYLDSDFCKIEYPNQTDRFIRVVLKQKIINSQITLEYGLWVSLSESSYNDYFLNYNNENHQTQYFGWLNNNIPDYNFQESIPTTVVTKLGNERPEIFPHSDFEHPFVSDYYNGITKDEVEKRIHEMLSKLTE
jgi:hypothetical protein